MKILHIIPSMDPESGGTRAGAVLLCKQSNAMGIPSELLCLDDPESYFLQNVDFKIHAIGPTIATYRKSKKLIPWLQQHAHEYTAIIIHGLWQYSSYGTWLGLRKCNTPYFVYTHGMLGPWFKKTYPLKHLKKWLYWPWAEYRVLRDAKGVLFTCEQEKILARESFWLYKANEKVVGFGAEEPPKKNNTNCFLEKYEILKNKRILLFVGRLHPVKGCDLLLEAFINCSNIEPDIHLVYAGPDQDNLQVTLQKRAIEFGVDKRVHFTGMISGDLKWDAYRSAELFILPSHHENFGVTVAEALACSLPVLITNKVNICREIEMDHAGLVANDTVEDVTKKLEDWFFLSDDQQKDFILNSRKCYEKRFTLDFMTNSFISAVNE